MPTLVSIIIVNWNAKNYLKKCIESLQEQTYQNFKIIFVDNASTDDSVEFVKTNFPKVKIIRNKENLGFAQGNNIGIKESHGEIICLFNPDAVAKSDWLSILVSALESSEKIGAVTGKMFYLGDEYGKNKVFCTWSKIDPYTATPYNFSENEPSSTVDYLTGAAMLLKREVFEKVGFLDPRYFLYFDETDWCARIIRAGYELLYVPNAEVWHKVSGSISDSDKKIYYMERSRIRFAIKNFDWTYLPIFHLNFFLESLYVFGRDIKNGKFTRTKIRLRAIFWNFFHFNETIQRRKNDFSLLKSNGAIKSYNKSLPLRKIKIPNRHLFSQIDVFEKIIKFN